MFNSAVPLRPEPKLPQYKTIGPGQYNLPGLASKARLVCVVTHAAQQLFALARYRPPLACPLAAPIKTVAACA
jgi:hypothetical protein